MSRVKLSRTTRRKVKIKYVTKCKNCGKFAKSSKK